MSPQLTHPSFLFLAKKSTSPLIFSIVCQNYGTRPEFITLSNKDIPTSRELTKQHASLFKLLNCDAMLSIILKRIVPDTNKVTMFGYIALSPPKDWVPHFHPRGNVHAPLYSGVTTLHLKSKKQRTNKKPSLIITLLKPFIQRPKQVKLPRREPSLPTEPTSKSTEKSHSATHQHCNCSRILFDQTPLSPDLTSNCFSWTIFCSFRPVNLPAKDRLLLQV